MGTKNKAVTAYLPEDIEAKLTEYCIEHGLSRQGKKSGKEKAALGTGIIEVLRLFFNGETHTALVAPTINKKEIKKIVSKNLPSNVPTADWVKTEIQQAIATFKQELENTIVPPELDPEQSSPTQEQITLNQADLAKRLNTNPSTLSRHHKKGQQHFAQWSKAQDPNKQAWQYDSTKDKNKFFKPIP